MCGIALAQMMKILVFTAIVGANRLSDSILNTEIVVTVGLRIVGVCNEELFIRLQK